MTQLHFDSVVVDSHNDLPIMLSDWYHHIGKTDYFSSWINACHKGGVKVQVIPIYLEPQLAEASLRKSLLLIELLHDEIENHADEVSLCLTGTDIDKALNEGKIAIIIALEGCSQIGEDVSLFKTFYRMGVRMASFTHLGRTLLADGSGEDATGSRLPSKGIEALKIMEDLGILMDVSHLSTGGVEHVLQLAKRPVIASHSSARAICDHHRNLSDEQLKAIARTGGVIGVNFLPAFIDAKEPSISRVVDHIEHMVDVVGDRHIGLGPDFIAEWAKTVYPNVEMKIIGIDLKVGIPGLSKTEDLPNLTNAMRERGFSESSIRNILGENWLRVFRKDLGIPL
ncbi:MAG: dipeptidase [Trueperaceae bacterium]|nr:dipeptidase [Trueperaceae bacterium]